MSYIFSLMAPSETLQLVRAFSNDAITEYKKQDTDALIGVMTYNNKSLLVKKFAFRQNIRSGCILKRPGICQGRNKSLTRAWGPVHAGCPYIQKRAKPGNFISPSFTRANINRILKKTMTLVGLDSGGIYPPRFSERSHAAIPAAGSTLRVVLTSGIWTESGYRTYIDAQLDEALNIARIALEQANSASSYDDKPPDIARVKKETPSDTGGVHK